MQLEHKHYFARIPTIFLLVLLGTVPWLAVVLFILRTIDRDAEKKERNAFQESQFASAAFRPQEAGAPKAAYDYSVHYTPDGMTADEQRKSRRRQQTLIKWCTVLGGLVLLAGVLSLPESISYGRWNDVFSNLTMIVGGGGALALGLVIRRGRRLERQLDKVVGGRDKHPPGRAVRGGGSDRKRGPQGAGKRHRPRLFRHGCLHRQPHRLLVVRGPAPIPAQPAPEPQPDAGGETQYQKLLRQLHQGRTGHHRPRHEGQGRPAGAGQRPHLRPGRGRSGQGGAAAQVYQLLPAHLPQAAAHLCPAGQPGGGGENIAKTKQSIERSLDLLVTAF